MLLPALFACHGDDNGGGGPAGADPSQIAWDADQSIDADFTVPAGSALTIAPGVVVSFAPEVALIIEGALSARGTPDAPITFTGAAWAGITFAEGAEDATFEGVDTYAAGSIVEDAVIEGATRGMSLQGASPYLHRVAFRDNEIPSVLDTVGGAGLLVSDGATPRIRECSFVGNHANEFAFGGGLYVDHADPIIQDCTFDANSSTYGGAISTDLMASPIVGSAFTGNTSVSEGGAISLVSTVSAVLGNRVVGNSSDTDGAGIHVCLDCNPHAAPYLLDNTVTDNTSANADPDDGAAGVGAAFLGAFVDNDVHGNLRGEGIPSDFGWFNLVEEAWPDWIAAPALSGTWWGTTDAAAVDATVFDGADSATYGIVQVDPVAAGPVASETPRAVIASRKLRYEDVGDLVPVFLTVYNPGPERAVHLAISQDGAPFAGELAYPGTTRDGDGWSIDMPENSVWFATIDASTYDGSVDDIAWEASLTDEGGVIGAPTIARFLFDPVAVQ
jgi:predicted outer membrane repeat protein